VKSRKEEIRGQAEIVIFVLAGVMDYRADIQTLHPCISRAVVE
jgi:hypothetical protein